VTAIFEGKFSKYSEAASYCERANLDKTYPAEIWSQRQIDHVNSAKQGIRPRMEVIVDLLRDLRTDLIVDFGGGGAWLYHLLRALNLDFRNYHLIETRDSLTLFEKILSKPNDISASTLEDASLARYESINSLLYSNSVFQYIPNCERVIDKLMRIIDWNYIVLDDIQQTSGESFWTCQRYYGYLTPYRFVNIEEILAPFFNEGFEIHLKTNFEANLSREWEFSLETNDQVFQMEKSTSVILRR
jgi:putative methyltransferase (TIGR04325 family)